MICNLGLPLDQSEANLLRNTKETGNLSIITAINRSFSTISSLQTSNSQVLIPFFSRSSTSPSSSNYDVFGIAGSPVYGALPLQPSTKTTFTNVGIGGTSYGSSTVNDLFINSSATLTSTSAPLAGQRTLISGDYSFYAYSSQFGRGYDVKFSVVPANSEIIDNDGRNVDASGDSSITSNHQGFFASSENGALSVPGYFLSASLFAGNSTNWARWFVQNSGTYELYAHIPKGSTASAVRYKVYTKGRPADGSCSLTNINNPCYETDPINQSTNQNSWVRLTASSGTVTRFNFVTSSTNSAYVGLSATAPNVPLGYYAGADAMKFVSSNIVTPSCLLAGANPMPTSLTKGQSVNLQFITTKNCGDMLVDFPAPIGRLPLNGTYFRYVFDYPVNRYPWQLKARDSLGNEFNVTGANGTLEIKPGVTNIQINSLTVNGMALKNGDTISGAYSGTFDLVLTFNQSVPQVNRELPAPYGSGFFGTSSDGITWRNRLYGFRGPVVGDMRIYPIDSLGKALPNTTTWVIKLNLK